MRQLRRAFAAAVAGLLIGTAGASAASTAEAISFTSVAVKQKQGKATFIQTDKDYVGSQQIGHDTLNCVVISKTGLGCNVEFVQAKGTLYLGFTQKFDAPSGHGEVLWGTGAYKNAAGTFTYKNLNKAGTRTQVAISLK